MVLPSIVTVCDALEMAALVSGQKLSVADLGRMFFPGQDVFDNCDDVSPVVVLNEAIAHGMRRACACGGLYPFKVTERSIEAECPDGIDTYLFMLLGKSLKLGGPKDAKDLGRKFERYFEDVVCWAMQKSGFSSQVLSIPREYRGLDRSLQCALRSLSDRFGDIGVLDPQRITSDDNDLDVDVIAVPINSNRQQPGWPSIQIQCTTGQLSALQAKLEEGSRTFCGVWEQGFTHATTIRAGATPDDLLCLHPVHWNRLCDAGWVLDRTRLVYLTSFQDSATLPGEVHSFWRTLWAARASIDWQSVVAY